MEEILMRRDTFAARSPRQKFQCKSRDRCSAPGPRAGNILLVEPYHNGRRALADILRQNRMSVEATDNKSEAVERARGGELDAIITEVVFSDREPCEQFIETLRKLQPGALIAVASGVVGCESLRRLGYDDPIPRARRSGATLCLPKPIDVPCLLSAVDSARAAQAQGLWAS